MTETRAGDPRDQRSPEPAADDSCVVCDFIGRSLDRWVFFLFAEGLGESRTRAARVRWELSEDVFATDFLAVEPGRPRLAA